VVVMFLSWHPSQKMNIVDIFLPDVELPAYSSCSTPQPFPISASEVEHVFGLAVDQIFTGPIDPDSSPSSNHCSVLQMSCLLLQNLLTLICILIQNNFHCLHFPPSCCDHFHSWPHPLLFSESSNTVLAWLLWELNEVA